MHAIKCFEECTQVLKDLSAANARSEVRQLVRDMVVTDIIPKSCMAHQTFSTH